MTEAVDHTGAIVVTPAQRRFTSWMADVLVYVVVLNLFVEFVHTIVIDTVWISILTAVLLQLLLEQSPVGEPGQFVMLRVPLDTFGHVAMLDGESRQLDLVGQGVALLGSRCVGSVGKHANDGQRNVFARENRQLPLHAESEIEFGARRRERLVEGQS